MRNREIIMKFSAVMVLMMYVLSLGGINVHSCSHTGETFVTFLAGGISCQEIHPSHHHHHHEGCHCCEEHDCDGSDGCCSNDSRMLLVADADNHHVEHIQAPLVAIAAVSAPVCVAASLLHAESSVSYAVPLPDSLRPLFSVMRV